MYFIHCITRPTHLSIARLANFDQLRLQRSLVVLRCEFWRGRVRPSLVLGDISSALDGQVSLGATVDADRDVLRIPAASTEPAYAADPSISTVTWLLVKG